MYLHCKHGFVEADAWNGERVPLADHQAEVEAIASVVGTVIVVRSRRSDTIHELISNLPRAHADGVLPHITVFESPSGWDYEWRAYLTPIEWGACLTRVSMELDYRNFKHTMQDHNPREYPLAMAIWRVANEHVEREGHDNRFDWYPGAVRVDREPGPDVCDRCGQATWRIRVNGKPLACDDCVTEARP